MGKSIISALALSISCLTSFAQNGIINGTIISKETGETIVGVNVYIDGTIRGTVSDIDGKYSITGLEDGTYTVAASFISFKKQLMSDIKISGGNTVDLDFSLEPESFGVDEVTITAKAAKNTENSLLIMQSRSAAIQDGISSQEIRRSGAGNAAESVKQVTGASVVDGKFVYIRGLGDRYTYTQLNGMTLISTDPYKNSPQLDMVPSNLLENIITSKSFTPDQPGTFTGGNINITTQSYPVKFIMSFSATTGYNTQSSMRNDFLTHKGGSFDGLGFDDGSRDLPEILKDPANRKKLTTSYYLKARRFRDTALFLDEATKSLNSQMAPVDGSTPLNQSYSFSIGNQLKIARRPLGYIAGINYRKSYDYYDQGTQAAWDITGSEALELFPYYNLEDRKGVENPQMNGLLNLNYQLTPRNDLGLTILYNKDTEKLSRYQRGAAPGIISGNDAFLETRTLSFKERNLLTGQLNGKHKMFKNVKLEWVASRTVSSQKEPDLRLFANTNTGDSLFFINQAEHDMPTHFFRYLNDTLNELKMDLTIPFTNDKNNLIKVGGLVNRKNRGFSEYSFYYRLAPAYQGERGMSYQGDPQDYFGESNLGLIDTTEGGGNVLGNYIIDDTQARNNYTGTESVAAAYGMVIYQMTKKLKVTGGARLEHTFMEVAGGDTSLAAGVIDTLDVLPSLSAVYALNKKMNLRGSYSHTIARPTMREMAPFYSFDFIGGFIYVGNPGIRRSTVRNMDLRWEYFVNPGEVVAASVFYKHFNDPIVRVFNSAASNPEIIFQNTENAKVYGLELDLRKKLDFISPGLKNFKFSGNFTYAISKVALDTAEYRILQQINPEIKSTRPFQGQSPYLFNSMLSYTQDSLDLEISAFFNYASKRLSEIGKEGVPDIYERPQPSLGLTVSKTFAERFQVKATAQNLLNMPYLKTQRYKGKEYVTEKYYTGRIFQLTLGYAIK